MTDSTKRDEIQNLIQQNDVVLFMKGTRHMPQCGFSSRVASILDYLSIGFHDVNVLESEEIRQGVKDFTGWPTIPQLYVKGEFVGGCDIITEMTMSGELDSLLNEKGLAFDAEAAERIRASNTS